MTEEDPTAIEPGELEVSKPEIPDMPPEEGVDPPTDEEEVEAYSGEFIEPEDAAVDDSIDDAEEEQPRHGDLPEGARREDYDD